MEERNLEKDWVMLQSAALKDGEHHHTDGSLSSCSLHSTLLTRF